MKILITNDDSYRSELLGYLVDLMTDYGELTIVAPEHQQSWKGKSITRYDDMRVQERRIFGCKGYLLDGTPADCVNFALYNLYEGLPDLLVSGINAGVNSGTGFVFSSGTVGASLEANIAGVPGIAVSTALDSESYNNFEVNFSVSAVSSEPLRNLGLPALRSLFDKFFADENFYSNPVTWNINLPHPYHEDLPVSFVSMARDYYGQLFVPRGDSCHWAMKNEEIRRDPRTAIDRYHIKQGGITVSKLSIHDFGQIDAETQEKLSKIYCDS